MISMSNRDHARTGIRVGLSGIAFAWLMLFSVIMPAKADDSFMSAKDPGVFIDKLGEAAIHSLTAPELNANDRRERFRDLLQKSFNVNGIARFVLGRYWNAATEQERDEYLKLFEELIVRTYADRFSEYSGEKFTVAKVQKDTEHANYATVFSTIARPGGQMVRVDWRVRQETDQSWRVVDVVIEGVSMSITQRSEFASVISPRAARLKP